MPELTCHGGPLDGGKVKQENLNFGVPLVYLSCHVEDSEGELVQTGAYYVPITLEGQLPTLVHIPKDRATEIAQTVDTLIRRHVVELYGDPFDGAT